MTNNKTNNNQTRVVCPICKTSFAIPEHQSIGCGIAIGKDSNLGTIYLTPEDKRLDALKAAGIDVSNFMKAADLLHNYKEEDEFNFDTKEIDEVISHPRGLVLMVGPTGSGKSTTVKMLLGLLYPTGGKLTVFGRSPRAVETKKEIGYLPEGAIACKYVHQIAVKKDLKLPLCTALYRVLNKEMNVDQVVKELLLI